MFNTNFFCAEAKFTLVEIGACQYPYDDLDAYVNRFHEKVLDCCDPMAEKVF